MLELELQLAFVHHEVDARVLSLLVSHLSHLGFVPSQELLPEEARCFAIGRWVYCVLVVELAVVSLDFFQLVSVGQHLSL